MKNIDREDYVKYRLEKAEETYEAAVILHDNDKWNSVINRLYYACFYAVSALLVRCEIEAKSHSGVKTQFFLNFIKTEKIDPKFGNLYTDLFTWRQEGDYDDFFDFTKGDVELVFKPSGEFIDEIKKIILSKSHQ